MKINGERHYLWRAVDHEGEVFESFVTKKRDMKAALKFLKKFLKRHDAANEFGTDFLRSYGADLRDLGIRERQQTGRWMNNRAENSHLAFRKRERTMLRFRRVRTLQKFASVHASVSNHFNQDRSLGSRHNFKADRRSCSRRVARSLRAIRGRSTVLAETVSNWSGSTRQGGLVAFGDYERRLLQVLPDQPGNHSPGSHDVRSVPSVASQCRGSAARAGHRYQP